MLPELEADPQTNPALFKWRERELAFQRLLRTGLPADAAPLALAKAVAELGDLERAVGDGGESYIQAFERLGHDADFIGRLRADVVPFLRQLGALGRGRVIRAVEELARRFNASQLELLMTCTSTMAIQGELLAQMRTLSLNDGGLFGIMLERCPTTSIGPIPIMQIRQHMCEVLALTGAGLSSCEVGLLAHYLAVNRSIKTLELQQNSLDQNMKAALGNALLANPFHSVQNVLLDEWGIAPDTTELVLGNHKPPLLPGDALLIAGALKGNRKVITVNVSSNQIGPVGVAKLVQALKNSPTVTNVDVAGNDLQREGALQFADLLTSSGSLLRLNLANNRLANPLWNGFPPLSKALEVNKSLKVLDISNNSLVYYHEVSRLGVLSDYYCCILL